jgi:hypothetical protein
VSRGTAQARDGTRRGRLQTSTSWNFHSSGLCILIIANGSLPSSAARTFSRLAKTSTPSHRVVQDSVVGILAFDGNDIESA